MTEPKVPFVLSPETAKMARALDGISGPDRQLVEDTITHLGGELIEADTVQVTREAGLMSIAIERMSEQDRNVLKGLVSRLMAKNKERR